MRYFCFLFSFFVFSVVLRSQTSFNQVIQDYNDYAYRMVKVNADYFFTSNLYTPYFQDDFRVISVDGAGNVRFSITINKHEVTVSTQLIQTLDKKIALIGYARSCDVTDASMKTFFIKMDENGYVKFDNTFSHINGTNGANDYLRDIVQYNDSSYFAVTDSVLFHFNKQGGLIKRKNTGLTGVREIDVRADGKFLLTSGGTASKFSVFDTSAVLLSQYPLAMVSSQALIKNSHTTYSRDAVIAKRDGSMQVVSTSSTAQGSGNSISDYCLYNDTIYACGYNSASGHSFVMRMDTSLNLISFVGDTTRKVSPVTVIASNSMISLLSNCKSAPATNGIISFSSFPKNSDYHFKEDIGITDIQLDTAYATFNSSAGSYSTNFQYYKFKLSIKNFSDHPVTNFQVNSLVNTGFPCGTDYYKEPCYNVSIAPGATYTFTTSWIQRYAGSVAGSLGSVIAISGNMCFNTSAPNKANDASILNDGACKTFTFSVKVTGMEEHADGITLQLFPNPANEQLTITTDARLQNITVYDVHGRVVKEIAVAMQSYELMVSDLKAGVYLILLDTDKGTATRRFVKE